MVRLVPNVVRARFSRYRTSLCHWSERYVTVQPFLFCCWPDRRGVKPLKVVGRTRREYIPPTREESCGFFFSPSSSSISFQSFVGGFIFVYSLGSIYIFPSTKIQYDGPLAFQNVVLCVYVLYVLQFWLTLYGLCRLWTWTAVCVHPLRSVASRRSSSWLDDIFFFFIGKAGTSSQLV